MGVTPPPPLPLPGLGVVVVVVDVVGVVVVLVVVVLVEVVAVLVVGFVVVVGCVVVVGVVVDVEVVEVVGSVVLVDDVVSLPSSDATTASATPRPITAATRSAIHRLDAVAHAALGGLVAALASTAAVCGRAGRHASRRVGSSCMARECSCALGGVQTAAAEHPQRLVHLGLRRR